MQWQDLVLGAGQIIFVVALLPSISSKDKPAFYTSVINAILLYMFAVIYLTLSLYLAALTITLTAAGWSILAYQKYKIDWKTK